MELRRADETLADRFADDVPELAYSTGPVSYDYHFERRSLFDAVVRRSWLTPGTLFGFDGATLALEGDELLGLEIGFPGPEFRERQSALAPLWGALVEAGEVTSAEVEGVVERAGHASWLNPVVRPRRYYIHALAVKPEQRGKQIGVRLIQDAMRRGREMECVALELDVLSDNPAVRFYRSQGLELLVESRAPRPEEYGVPPEWRMGIDLKSE